MERKVILFTFASLLFLTPMLGFSKDFFLYDHEQSEIITINDGSTTEIIQKIGLTKNPDLIMATGVATKFLAVYHSRWIRDVKGQIRLQPGKLIIFNAQSGRTEDLLEIGFAPYHWAYTKDRTHFFITYYTSPKKESIEVVHYNIMETKPVTVGGIEREIVDLKLSFDDNSLLAIVNSANLQRELVTFQITPFQIKSKLDIGPDAQRLFILGPERAALVALNSRNRKTVSGNIKIIDTYGKAVVEERKLSFPNTGVYWFEKNRSLFVTNGKLAGKLMKGRIYRITETGIRQHQLSRPWAGFSYLLEQERLYILNDTDLTLIDYAQHFSKNLDLGRSNYHPSLYHYFFQCLPQTNLAIIACFQKGYLLFYDLEKNQTLKKVRCGRTGERNLNRLSFKGDTESRTVATTNQSQSRFYVLNCATRDITVYDQEFNILKFLVPEEPPLAIFQVNQPTLGSLVVTTKGLYKIDEEVVALVRIAEFATGISRVNYFETKENSMVLYTDRLLMVLEPESFKVKHRFHLYGDPQDKYTKLRNNERRYYFIPEL